MKIFSAANGKPLNRRTAHACAFINLLATPGLGTLMAGRFFAGAIQLAFASFGCALVLKWYYGWFTVKLTETGSAPAWEWRLGLMFFGAGWLGALWSSLSLLRTPPESTLTPPKLDGTPG